MPGPAASAGQTTAEYALVLSGVAAIALLVVAWAGDTNRIGRLLDGVLDSIRRTSRDAGGWAAAIEALAASPRSR